MYSYRIRLACLGALVAFTGLGYVDAQILGATGSNNDTGTPTKTDGDITIHYVTVGEVENTFQPNSINAAVGDIVTFQFFPKNHSVIRSAFGYPCIPIQDVPSQKGPTPFFSGFEPTANIANPVEWNLTINDTNPVFYYCGATGSCVDWGMLGVINANAETPLTTQIKLARNAQYMLTPGEEAPNEAQLASLSAAAQTATATITVSDSTPTATASGAAAGNSSGSGGSSSLSSGAVAGIAIGTAAAALIVAGLIFLVRRNHLLERKLHDERTKSQYGMPPGPDMASSPATYNNHNSFGAGSGQMLGGYVPYRDLNRNSRDPNKPFDSVVTTESWRDDEYGATRMSAPPAAFSFNGEQYVAVPAREYHRASGALQVNELDSSTRESSDHGGGGGQMS